MSADNWSLCPRCHLNHAGTVAEAERRVERAYGKAPREEYERLVREAMELKEPGQTLREDWELGMGVTGHFCVGYQCHCEVCGFSFSFKHTEKVEVEKHEAS